MRRYSAHVEHCTPQAAYYASIWYDDGSEATQMIHAANQHDAEDVNRFNATRSGVIKQATRIVVRGVLPR